MSGHNPSNFGWLQCYQCSTALNNMNPQGCHTCRINLCQWCFNPHMQTHQQIAPPPQPYPPAHNFQSYQPTSPQPYVQPNMSPGYPYSPMSNTPSMASPISPLPPPIQPAPYNADVQPQPAYFPPPPATGPALAKSKDSSLPNSTRSNKMPSILGKGKTGKRLLKFGVAAVGLAIGADLGADLIDTIGDADIGGGSVDDGGTAGTDSVAVEDNQVSTPAYGGNVAAAYTQYVNQSYKMGLAGWAAGTAMDNSVIL